ncbi:Mannosyl-oligosaccharide 1,2-alpha-mannosidase IB [Thoreauomyces humboldtii]|nr:Mannosyl-oligosaccharide 1,2-alpha-mannosidase IB [Thoreauomyces humboldtii]
MPRLKHLVYTALALLSIFFLSSYLSTPPPLSAGPEKPSEKKAGTAERLAHVVLTNQEEADVKQDVPPVKKPLEPRPKVKAPIEKPAAQKPIGKPSAEKSGNPGITGKQVYPFPLFLTEDRGDADEKMMDLVREMMAHAWDGYVKHASGADELLTNSHRPFNWYPPYSLLSTPVDSLDTLHIMGLTSRFEDAKKMVLQNLDFDIDTSVSLFETNIRVMGGLLSAWELDGDKRFLDLAEDLAERFNHAFDTPSGLPINSLNLKTRKSEPSNDAVQMAGLAEIGTLQLELQFLADVTDNLVYSAKALKAYDILHSAVLPFPGLYPTKWPVEKVPDIKTPMQEKYSVGAEADSFYEYLLKMWLSTGETKWRDMYDQSAEVIKEHMVQYDGKNAYIPDATSTSAGFSQKSSFHHLSCFAGGMFATGALTSRRNGWASFLDIGTRITQTCWDSYARTKSGLGPEEIYPKDLAPQDMRYQLRPETIESIFYMHRFTHDPIYREMGKAFVASLNKHCRSEAGFGGLRNVLSPNQGVNDLQQSFFLAETLKYAYLLFTDDDTIPLEAYVFNTEAHPVSMRGWGKRKDIPRGRKSQAD